MHPQASILMPEINADDIVNNDEHVTQLFWYYYTNDGIERDKEMVQDLIMSGQLDGKAEDACTMRQLGILTTLTRVIDIFNAVWAKGTGTAEKQSSFDPEVLKQVLARQAYSYKNDTCIRCNKAGSVALCGRCKKVKYCGRECQTTHWKEHKVHCKQTEEAEALDRKAALKKKLDQKKKEAKEKVNNKGPKISTR